MFESWTVHYGNILIGILVLALIFFLFREFFCWYWKLNKIVDLLQSIDRRLQDQEMRAARAAPAPLPPPPPQEPPAPPGGIHPA
ncbi:MAG: hypothetical protein O2807_09250 [bacterium]|nr:hypothetical protein [bacterium]